LAGGVGTKSRQKQQGGPMSEFGDITQPIDVSDILQDDSVVKLYVNGLTVGLSLSDVFVVVNNGPKPVAILQMSLTTAKTMMVSLTGMIEDFEQKTEQPLLTMQEINEKCFGGIK
jgi:hypothetical protein